MSDSYYHPLPHPHGLLPASLLSPWHFPSKNTGVGSHSLLHGNPYPGIEHGSPVLQADCLLSEPPRKLLEAGGLLQSAFLFWEEHSCYGCGTEVLISFLDVSRNYCRLLKATCRSLTVGLRISAAKNFLACVKSFSNSEALWFPLLRPSGENSLLLKGLYD